MHFPPQDRNKSIFWNTVSCSEYQTMGKAHKPNDPYPYLTLTMILIFCTQTNSIFAVSNSVQLLRS